MTKPQTRNAVEIHGCIVCARLFNILVVYAADGSLVDCVVTSPGGHRVPDDRRPLVACDAHAVSDIESAYGRWESVTGGASMDEPDDE